MHKVRSRVIIVVVQVRTGKSYIPSSSGGAQEKKRKEGMKLSLAPKLMEKVVWTPVIFRFVKFHSQLSIRCPIMPKLAILAPLIA